MKARHLLVLCGCGAIALTVYATVSLPRVAVYPLQEGSVKFVGLAEYDGKTQPEFPPELGSIGSWSSTGKGTRYLAFQFPTELPQGCHSDGDRRRKVGARAYILGPNGDRYSIPIEPGKNRRFGYVMVPKFEKLDPDHVDVALDCDGHRTSVYRLDLPDQPKAAPLPILDSMQVGDVRIEAIGFRVSGRDGQIFPRLGAAVRYTGDPTAKYQWKDIRYDAPERCYPKRIGGAWSSTLPEDNAPAVVSDSTAEPFAGLANRVIISGVLVERKSNGSRSMVKQVQEIPFRFCVPVVNMDAPGPSYATEAGIGDDVWPEAHRSR